MIPVFSPNQPTWRLGLPPSPLSPVPWPAKLAGSWRRETRPTDRGDVTGSCADADLAGWPSPRLPAFLRSFVRFRWSSFSGRRSPS